MPPGHRPQDAWKGGAAAPARPGVKNARAPSANRWFGAAFLLVAILGIIAGLLWYLRKSDPPQLVVIAVDQYLDRDWSPNPWAQAEATGAVAGFPTERGEVIQIQEREKILSELNRVAKPNKNWKPEAPVVVYLCMLGTVADGKVYFIPGDAKPDKPETWIALDDVLKPFADNPEKRLLVLDIRPALSPRAHLPVKDVNEVLDEVLADRAKKSNLPFLVLTANTPWDGPNVLRPLKRSVFGLAFTHGANGAADGWGADGSADHRVTANELAAYVCEVTLRVSMGAGLSPQLPRCHGTAKDFELLHVPQDRTLSLPAIETPDEYPKALDDGWKERDVWIGAGVHRRSPRLIAHWSRAASRADQRWRAGLSAKDAVDTFTSDAGKLRVEKGTIAPPKPLLKTVASVRLKPGMKEAAAKAEKSFRPLIGKLTSSGKGDDPKTGLPMDFKERLGKVLGSLKDVDPDACAVALFDVATTGQNDPTHLQLRAIIEVASVMDLHHVEFTFIALIAGLSTEQVRDRWPPGTVRLLLDVVRRSEEAVAFDGRVMSRIQSQVQPLDRTRRELLHILCNPAREVEEYRKAMSRLGALAKDYARLQELAAELMKAWEEYEETRAELADLAVRFPHALVAEQKGVTEAWTGLVDEYPRLEAMLGVATATGESPPGDAPTFNEVIQRRDAVRKWRTALFGMIPTPEQLSGVRALELALDWPAWDSGERTRLLSRLKEADQAATEKALKAWPTKSAGTPTLERKDSAKVESASERDLRRAVDLLALTRATSVPELRKAAPATFDAAFALRVRNASRELLEKDYQESPLARQAAMGWGIDPDVVAAYPKPSVSAPSNPEWLERSVVERNYRSWLIKERYLTDAAEMAKVNIPQSYPHERVVAKHYAESTERIAREFEE